MKKAIPALLVIFMVGTALSHSGGLPDAGSTPGSMFFAVDRAQESLSLMFSSDEDKPAKRLRIAEERLAEAQKLAAGNRSDRASKALDMYNERMSELERESPEMVKNKTEGHVKVLEQLKQRLPDAANNGIQKAMETSAKGVHSEAESEDVHGGFMATGRVIKGN